MNPIPYARHEITEADIEAVASVLRSEFLTQGPQVPAFEAALTRYTGARHAIAVNSATSALHIACLALGLGPGDWLWTSPVTFLASANCALYCGAQVDFVDIDPCTYNLSPDALSHKLEQAEREGKLPKVLVAVHMGGQSCDMKAMRLLSRRYGFKVIEDASHAVGGKYEDQPVGDCRYSDIAVFSFHPAKIVTAAEGGAALTNSDELASKMALLRSHGLTRDHQQMVHPIEGPWYYEQIELGFNYRMTDIHAALGTNQMKRVDDYVSRRQAVAKRYAELFAGLPLKTPRLDERAHSAFHLYVVRLDLARSRRNQRELFEFMRARGIGVNLHYIPIYRQPFYERMGFDRREFVEAESYYSQAMTLPMFPLLREEELRFVAATLAEGMGS